MELERSFINLNRQKGTALSQITLEEDLNVPDQKADIFKIIHGQGEFCPDEIKGETGKIKVRGVFVYRILYIGEDQNRMPEVLEGSIPVDETVFLNELEGRCSGFSLEAGGSSYIRNSFQKSKHQSNFVHARGGIP